ncbi:class I SAM-dependent methyltransferase [Brevirhabdus sp.]|uniref:class I SAM-dependent methyltransferase n=1 Tax=Brevirhabdus sp. TaxID=2004514 RepID=UPI004057CF27
MTIHRVTLAQASGALALPEAGAVGAFRLRGDSVPDIGLDRLEAMQSFAPDHAALRRLGVRVTDDPRGPYAAVLVQATRSKQETRALIARALEAVEPAGMLLVDGQKVDGIDSILRDLRRKGLTVETFPKAHGRLIWFQRPADDPLADWRDPPVASPEGFVTAPGIFSAEKVDPGSELLARHLPPLRGRVADLGAGWGYLSRRILEADEADRIVALDLVEAEGVALDCARQNVTDPRAGFHWADTTVFEGAAYDVVVMNPPFHVSRASDPALGADFIAAAARLLKPAGALWMVANRHLPYERPLGAAFRKVEETAAEGGFKILHAATPRRGR